MKNRSTSYSINLAPSGAGDSSFGERNLWCNAIQQALADLCPQHFMAHQKVKLSPRRKAEQKEAFAWLMGDPEDFFLVCMLAGVEPTQIRRGARILCAKYKIFSEDMG